MKKLTHIQLVIVVFVSLFVTGAVISLFMSPLSKKNQPKEEQETQGQQGEGNIQVFSMTGYVLAVNKESESFTFAQTGTEKQYTVFLGKGTEFTKAVVSQDPTVAAQRQSVTIAGLQVGNLIFVLAEEAIQKNLPIVNPSHLQILR